MLLFSACTPEGRQRRAEQRIARIAKKHPGVVKSDTTWTDTTVAVPVIKDSTTFSTGSDTAAVDSLTKKFEGKVQPEILDSLNEGFKAILDKAGDIDTTITTGKTKIHYKKKKGKTTINVEVKPDPVPFKYPTKVNTIKPPAALTWYERQLMKIGKKVTETGIAFLGLLLLYFVYRIIKKQFFD